MDKHPLYCLGASCVKYSGGNKMSETTLVWALGIRWLQASIYFDFYVPHIEVYEGVKLVAWWPAATSVQEAAR